MKQLLSLLLGLIGLTLSFNQCYDFSFYIDSGPATIADIYDYFSNKWLWSLNFFSSSSYWFYFLNFSQALASIFLILGKQRKISSIILWILVISFQNRNPFILYGGDAAFRLLLLSYIFILFDKKFGSFVFIFQLSMIYFFSALLKLTAPAWRNGVGFQNGLELTHLSTFLGELILSYPFLLKIGNYGTILLEISAPFILFYPLKYKKVRTIHCLVFISFHLMIFLFFKVGLFSLVMIFSWLGVLVQRNEIKNNSKSLAVYCLLILLINFQTILNTNFLKPINPIISVLRIDQHWGMFDNPIEEPDGVFLISLDNSELQSFELKNHRWTKLMMTIYKQFKSETMYEASIQRWLCQKYSNNFKLSSLRSLDLYFLNRKSMEKENVLSVYCP